MPGDRQPATHLDPALVIVERFGPIFPTKAKKPLTAHGSRDATKDARQIIEWRRRWPDFEITLLTGEPSGVVALDVDIKPGRNGLDSLDELGIAVHPVTRTAHSPSGGLHLLFQWPGRFVKTTADRIGPGLEVKGDNGWITLPPRPGGFWDPLLGLDAPLAPMPKWMTPREAEEPRRQQQRRRDTAALSPYGRAALDNAARRIISAAVGTQEVVLNTTVFGIAQLAGGGVIPASVALEGMLWAARQMPSHNGRRPWRVAEVERKVTAAFTDGLCQSRAVSNAR